MTTNGTKLAAKIRAKCNGLSNAERKKLWYKAMKLMKKASAVDSGGRAG